MKWARTRGSTLCRRRCCSPSCPTSPTGRRGAASTPRTTPRRWRRVAGAGAGGKTHGRTAAALADAELAAVCDTDPKVRERVARQHPAVHVTGDIGELLGRVDAVIVAAPAATHARLALQCIEA